MDGQKSCQLWKVAIKRTKKNLDDSALIIISIVIIFIELLLQLVRLSAIPELQKMQFKLYLYMWMERVKVFGKTLH